MLIDARQVPEENEIDAEVCIVGAGAAGIALARHLAAKRVAVCLLESGGMEYEEATQNLYAGTVIGREYHDLDFARLRYFGGTTNHWSGWCGRLDPLDLQARPYLPSQGWGFAFADLEPYYAPAGEVCQLPLPSFEAKAVTAELPGIYRQPLNEYGALAKMWQLSPPTRFGEVYGAELEAAPTVRCLLHANVVGIDIAEGGTAVERLRIRTLGGNGFHVKARAFVLATGGIENARLLLQPTEARPRGVGNDTDQVGRYFMLHPMLHAGTLLAGDSNGALLRGEHELFIGGLSLSSGEQVSRGLPNHVINFIPGQPRWVAPPAVATLKRIIKRPFAQRETLMDDLKMVLGDLDDVAGYAYDRASQSVSGVFGDGSPPPDFYTVLLRMEQVPNPDSRIELSDERDALGLQRVALNWHFADGEREGVRRTVERMGEILGAMSVGRLQLSEWLVEDERDFPNWVDGDYHHMGATRMSDTPETGVVDWDGRVHGVPNLYVAGSSTFHTGGSANPTLTIVAMALRLGDHLVEELAVPNVSRAMVEPHGEKPVAEVK